MEDSWNVLMLVSILASLSCFYWCEARCVEQDRIALLTIKNSINFPDGSALPDWKGEDCCQWYGVECDSSKSRVTHVLLDNTRESSSLQGSWYPNATAFAQLQELKVLNLDKNQIGGWVMPQGMFSGREGLQNLWRLRKLRELTTVIFSLLAELCRLWNLELLSISGNQLTRLPSCMGNLLALEIIDLTSNNITESQAVEDLCGVMNLQELYLRGNQLNELPRCMRNMSFLGTLEIDTYNFTSSLSLRDFCGFGNLQLLSLGWNLLIPLPHCLRNIQALGIECSRVNDPKAVPLVVLEELCIFKNLRSLSISDNDLADESIPSCFANLSSLQYMSLSNNQLMGSLDLGGLKNLSELHLNGNQLIQLPRCLENSTSLALLYLDDNNLNTSTSLEGLCRIRNLQFLSASHNQMLDASIPSCLGNLSYLDLSHNQLTDNFDFCALQSIYYLDLSENQLTQIPHCLGNLTSLTYLHLRMNNLMESPALDGLCMLSHLDQLTLSGNRLGGSIPPCLGHLSLTYLNLASNQFNGSIHSSTLYNLTSLLYIDISKNNMDGMLPKDIGFLLPNLSYFNMSSNILQGSIPQSFANMKHLRILDLSNNIFSGEIPNQVLSNATLLEYLDLSNNDLRGDMFSRDFNMLNMKALYLYGNRLTGVIPQTLCNSLHLKILDIRNNFLMGGIPSWISCLSQLNALLMKGNYFNGQIPIQLCKLQNLRILDISHNMLTGRIPSCFNNITSWKEESQTEIIISQATPNVEFMTKSNTYSYRGIVLFLMTGIDISSNQLTGNIPIELGYLSELHSLNFSNNNLIGQIPESFKNLEKIESLDMSFNQLNGAIPPTLIQLYFISTFSVAHNNLSGRVLNANQFSTFDESSYEGNLGLCGRPLKRNCSSDSIPVVKQDEGEGYDIIDNTFLFYLMIAVSYMLGFWGSIFFLYFNKKIRIRYFEATDRYIHYSFLCLQYLSSKMSIFKCK